jgi:lysophospholipase L1-like esterase
MPLSETRAARLALRAWYAFRLLRLRSRAQPVDVPAIRTGDLTADRLLVVGNGPSHGWGVLSHQLGLIGQLGEAMTRRTGRACDVDLIGAEAMNVRSALAWIGDRDLSGDDLVLLVVGFNDALRLTPVAAWRREMAALLDGITARIGDASAIAVAGIPPVGAGLYGTLSGQASEHHRLRLNTATRQVAARRRIRVVDLPQAIDAGADAAARYRELADHLAERVAPLVTTRRPLPEPRLARADRVWDWSGTSAIVEAARTGGEPELRRLTDLAQKTFGVELATVSLVDGDRLFHGVNTDVLPESVPLELSFCRYTVETDEAVVIPDTGRDERFADNPLTDVSFINFYAGYPLHARDGHVIGSFCVQGSRPHKASHAQLEELRRLAGEAEAVLRSYEAPPPIPVGMPLPIGAPITFG